MKRIAIVNQRYGKEVNGGSEDYARELAHRLSGFYKVDVITTTALDYQDWAPWYSPGTERDGNVTVKRFPVKTRRMVHLQNFLSRSIFHVFPFSLITDYLWIIAQGPWCPQAVRYLKKHEKDYEAVIFVTYLYYLTAAGLPKVSKKAVLVPTAHDEFPIHYPYYRKLLTLPAGLAFLTEEERILVDHLAPGSDVKKAVAGSGVDVPDSPDVAAFRKKYGIQGEYLIYAGRVDEAKGCRELFTMFEGYKKQNPGALKLVTIGKMIIEDPQKEDILCLGFVSEEEKYQAIAGAKILILPSKYESLSISVLEAMALGVPVLVNGNSKVLKAHCDNSGAGKYYLDDSDFCSILQEMLSDPEELLLERERGIRYVQDQYSWSKTIRTYCGLIEDLAAEEKASLMKEKEHVI